MENEVKTLDGGKHQNLQNKNKIKGKLISTNLFGKAFSSFLPLMSAIP